MSVRIFYFSCTFQMNPVDIYPSTDYLDDWEFVPTHFGRELSQPKALILRLYVACINTNQRKIPAENSPAVKLQPSRGSPVGPPVNRRWGEPLWIGQVGSGYALTTLWKEKFPSFRSTDAKALERQSKLNCIECHMMPLKPQVLSELYWLRE